MPHLNNFHLLSTNYQINLCPDSQENVGFHRNYYHCKHHYGDGYSIPLSGSFYSLWFAEDIPELPSNNWFLGIHLASFIATMTSMTSAMDDVQYESYDFLTDRRQHVPPPCFLPERHMVYHLHPSIGSDLPQAVRDEQGQPRCSPRSVS